MFIFMFDLYYTMGNKIMLGDNSSLSFKPLRPIRPISPTSLIRPIRPYRTLVPPRTFTPLRIFASGTTLTLFTLNVPAVPLVHFASSSHTNAQ